MGDIHGAWSDADSRWFETQNYDRVLVVGDLAGLRFSGTLAIARALAGMNCATLVFPGNHDATSPWQLVGHSIGLPGLGRGSETTRRDQLAAALGAHPMVGYSTHELGPVSLVALRPHSMGGPTLAFPGLIREAFGIGSLAESRARLEALIDGTKTDRLVFLAHNGPTGCGADRAAIWGADFKPRAGDWGDPDTRHALDYARSRGKRVLCLLAGHMHRRLRGGGERVWRMIEQDTLLINAAEVPRIKGGRHHHVAITLDGDQVIAEDRWVELT